MVNLPYSWDDCEEACAPGERWLCRGSFSDPAGVVGQAHNLSRQQQNISALPGPVKASFGHQLRQLQDGKTALDMKPLPQFGAGVFELRERFERNAYRLMYVVSLSKALYVLHAFMKKSKSGIGLPKPDVELIKVRLQSERIRDAED
jgi:phage-related protein